MTQRSHFFSAEEIRDFARRSDWRGGWLVFHAWAVILLAMAGFVWWPNPLTFLLAVMIIGSRQLGLVILMHDAAHNALFKNQWLNEFVGEWLCGRPIFAELGAYRRYHLKHHRHTQTEEDPDLILSAPFPTTRASLTRKFMRDLTGRTGFKQRRQQVVNWMKLAGDEDAIDEAARQEQKLAQTFNGPGFGASLVVNGVLFALLALAGYWWLYPALWLVPMFTWYQLVTRIRNIAEHGVVEKSENPLRNVRTTLANPLERAFIAPYWVNYHLEHHLIMHVPCWQLPRMHRRMLEQGYKDKMEIGAGYLDVLRLAGSRTG